MREVDQQLLRRALTVVRRGLPVSAWDLHAASIALDRSSHEEHLRKADDEVDRTLFGDFERFRGAAHLTLPFRLEPHAVAAIRTHLEGHAVHPGPHTLSSMDGCRQAPLDEIRRTSSFAGYTLDQVLRTPGLIDLFNRPAIVDFVEHYLRCVPTLYSLNAWWSFPAAAPELGHVQFFHRDSDDWKFCTLFLYLTDVDLEGGPHQVVPGSQTVCGMEHVLARARDRGEDVDGFEPAASFASPLGSDWVTHGDRLFKGSIHDITGPAGTMFLVNPLALHRGLVPSRTPRLMVWARYGLGPNTNSADQERGPLSRSQLTTTLRDTPRNRYINRLLFEFDRGPFIPGK